MDFYASLVDQMLEGEIERHTDILPYQSDQEKRKSATFVIFCMAKRFRKQMEEALDWFTCGGQDAGVDVLTYEATSSCEIHITSFQGTYACNFESLSPFPRNAIKKTIAIINNIFDPSKSIKVHNNLRFKLEEIRSFIRDGYLPVVHVILCNNGKPWDAHAQQLIDAAQFAKDQVIWEHFNHNSIINILKKPQKINTSIQFTGKSIYEQFREKNFFIGKVNVIEISQLIKTYGDELLEGNIHRFLSIGGSHENLAINDLLMDAKSRDDFYFTNQGITIVCTKMSYNALREENHLVKLENARIVSGWQIAITIAKTVSIEENAQQDFATCFVLVRIYEINDSDKDIIRAITYATNKQNPVSLMDLHANDDCQKELTLELKQLGFTYTCDLKEGVLANDILESHLVAEATLAIWRKAPHQTKYMCSEHFGKLYDKILKNLNAAEAALAVLILRRVENLCKHAYDPHPLFLPYASHYIAMIIGMELCRIYEHVTMQNYHKCVDCLEQNFSVYYTQALEKITLALENLYNNVNNLSLQQLAATFRRGDLLQIILSQE